MSLTVPGVTVEKAMEVLVRVAAPLEVLYTVERHNPTLGPDLQKIIEEAVLLARRTVNEYAGGNDEKSPRRIPGD